MSVVADDLDPDKVRAALRTRGLSGPQAAALVGMGATRFRNIAVEGTTRTPPGFAAHLETALGLAAGSLRL